MPLSLTRDELAAFHPCNCEQRLALFGRRKRMTAKQALDAGASISDLLWVAGEMGRKDLCVKFALACAQSVAHLNTDLRVEAALKATQVWLDCPSDENADAADAAARAAYAAYAADQSKLFLEIFG